MKRVVTHCRQFLSRNAIRKRHKLGIKNFNVTFIPMLAYFRDPLRFQGSLCCL